MSSIMENEEQVIQEEVIQEENVELELNIGVISEVQGQNISLSDLYGIPVFRGTTEQAVTDYENKVKAQMQIIDEHVFSEMIDLEQQSIERIRAGIFEKTNQITKPAEDIIKEKDSYAGMIILGEIIGVLFILLIIAYSKKRKRERAKKIDYIDNFSDEARNEY
jgi:hypothetical protein